VLSERRETGPLPQTPRDEEPADDARLLSALQGGSEAGRRQALTALYRRHAGRLRDYYRRHGASAAEADDWTQDTFMRVLRRAHTVREPQCLTAWVWTTARRVMIDALRQRRGHQPLTEAAAERLVDPAAPVAEQLAREQRDQHIREAFERFATLHPERARCLMWATVDDLATAEIADILGRSPGATREYVSQCRKKLRPFLSGLREG